MPFRTQTSTKIRVYDGERRLGTLWYFGDPGDDDGYWHAELKLDLDDYPGHRKRRSLGSDFRSQTAAMRALVTALEAEGIKP